MNDYDDGYGENDWRDNKDNLMWRYWAAKEMAIDLMNEDIDRESITIKVNDKTWYIPDYANYLAQLLKKEWFRK